MRRIAATSVALGEACAADSFQRIVRSKRYVHTSLLVWHLKIARWRSKGRCVGAAKLRTNTGEPRAIVECMRKNSHGLHCRNPGVSTSSHGIGCGEYSDSAVDGIFSCRGWDGLPVWPFTGLTQPSIRHCSRTAPAVSSRARGNVRTSLKPECLLLLLDC